MSEAVFKTLAIALAAPTVLSAVVGFVNYFSMMIMFVNDRQVKGWDKWPTLLMGFEIEYARDAVGADPNSKYAKPLKTAKICGVVFMVGFLSLIALGVSSVFLMEG